MNSVAAHGKWDSCILVPIGTISNSPKWSQIKEKFERQSWDEGLKKVAMPNEKASTLPSARTSLESLPLKQGSSRVPVLSPLSSKSKVALLTEKFNLLSTHVGGESPVAVVAPRENLSKSQTTPCLVASTPRSSLIPSLKSASKSSRAAHSLVKQAVLSYEENLALLSPESCRKFLNRINDDDALSVCSDITFDKESRSRAAYRSFSNGRTKGSKGPLKNVVKPSSSTLQLKSKASTLQPSNGVAGKNTQIPYCKTLATYHNNKAHKNNLQNSPVFFADKKVFRANESFLWASSKIQTSAQKDCLDTGQRPDGPPLAEAEEYDEDEAPVYEELYLDVHSSSGSTDSSSYGKSSPQVTIDLQHPGTWAKKDLRLEVRPNHIRIRSSREDQTVMRCVVKGSKQAVRRPKTPPPLPPIQTQHSAHSLTDLHRPNSSKKVVRTRSIPAVKDGYYGNITSSPMTRDSVTSSDSSTDSYNLVEEVQALIPESVSLHISLSAYSPQIQSKMSPFEEEPLYQFFQEKPEQAQESGSLRPLWSETAQVRASGILATISSKERLLQEKLYEVLSSESSYFRSLCVLTDHFAKNPELYSENPAVKSILTRREYQVIFSNVFLVKEVSQKLLRDLESHWAESAPLLKSVGEILLSQVPHMEVYVRYCTNMAHQQRAVSELTSSRPHFSQLVARLEADPVCRGLPFHSFLLLPFQRVTRLPLLLGAVLAMLEPGEPQYAACVEAYTALSNMVRECNEGIKKMERMEEMLLVSQQLLFKECKSIPLISMSRWLVKRGELIRLTYDSSQKLSFGLSRWCKTPLHFFLFNDLLVIARKKSEDCFEVVDHCIRSLVTVLSIKSEDQIPASRLPAHVRHLIQLILLSNHQGKMVEMYLVCPGETERMRWVEAINPAPNTDPDSSEKHYQQWDCPQAQCTHSYQGQQPDELTLEVGDSVNVFRKMKDGWWEGERTQDGQRGWFPATHVKETESAHSTARNLRQCHRMLAQQATSSPT